MIREIIGTLEVIRYDDIDELVVFNYNLFNEYGLLDAEVGSDLPAIESHFKKLDFFLARKDADQALQVRKNQHQAFYHLFNGTNFPALQWAAMLKSVGGDKIDDYSLASLTSLLRRLSDNGLTMGKVKKDVLDVKKKFARS